MYLQNVELKLDEFHDLGPVYGNAPCNNIMYNPGYYLFLTLAFPFYITK